jgi:hypothetical protein
MVEKRVSYPSIAVVYDGFTGQLRRKIVPGRRETASFALMPGENYVQLLTPPYDDATCRKAVLAVTGHSWR